MHYGSSCRRSHRVSSLNQKEFFFFSKSSSHKPCLCRCAVAGCALVEGPMTDAPSAEAAPAPAAEQEAPRTPDAKHRPSSTPEEKRGSCAPCRRAHAGCDGMRPCRRCISSHQEANCTDQVRCPFYRSGVSHYPQVPGSAPPRAPRTPPTVQPAPLRGEGEGGPCTDCQFGSRSNVHCPFNRCRTCIRYQ